MSAILQAALYNKRKRNRFHANLNVVKAETKLGNPNDVFVYFNFDISATVLTDGWSFIVNGNVRNTSGAVNGGDFVQFTLAIPVSNGDVITYLYKQADGDYKNSRDFKLANSTGHVFNYI